MKTTALIRYKKLLTIFTFQCIIMQITLINDQNTCIFCLYFFSHTEVSYLQGKIVQCIFFPHIKLCRFFPCRIFPRSKIVYFFLVYFFLFINSQVPFFFIWRMLRKICATSLFAFHSVFKVLQFLTS